MTRSRQVFSTASFAKRGASVMLAATLAVGSVPAISLAQANLGMEGAPIALAAEGSGYDLEVGKAYVVGATWSNDFNMGARFLGSQATVVFDGGSYAVKMTLADEGKQFIDSAILTFGGAQYRPDGEGTFTFPFAALEDSFSLTITKMGDMPIQPTVQVSLDLSSLPVGQPEPEPEP
ncbi:MAG TPA: hypothetical protein IAB86_08305, partial [Candidatus Aphodovivens avicola]|nr:hypothetical protein [Candidatus Aphodovivens avicola]